MTGNHCSIDFDLALRDIQSLDSADSVVAFFARLGYNIGVRIKQEPDNLGIVAESVLRPIEHIELVANQDNLLQVYLFELKSVTVAHTRALARVFRNRFGHFLLVLTSDYERIDFVLIEKFIPAPGAAGSGPSEKQTGVRPRVLTVPRRHPDRVHLRVLRRFTNTEADVFAQYDKLLSAFTIADWSEEYFNNRALFSDYYLTQRLTASDAWKEDPKPVFRSFVGLYRDAAGRWANKPEKEVRSGLIEPALDLLGFTTRMGKSATDAASEPDYRLHASEKAGKPLAACLVYTWGRSLDGKDHTRDKDTPDENPGAIVVSVLEKGEAPWAIVTNGKTWRLYSARTHSRATNYYEIDLEEVLASGGPAAGDPAEAFKYFWLLFRREAFEETKVAREGEIRRLPYLDHLLDECHQYAKELGERLKDRVFDHVFVHFSRGFLENMKQLERNDATVSQDELDYIFRGTLTFLYRVLFLLYAEARDLLPVREMRGYWHKSIENLKREIADAAGSIADDVDGKLKKRFSANKYELYDRLTELCSIVDGGDAANNVPTYNGGLFMMKPDVADDTDESESAHFLAKHKITDFHLARGLDWLARDLDPKRNDLVPVDYKTLGVRQLGSIYEGLLEFKLRIASQKMAIVKGKKAEEVIPYREAKAKKRKILKDGRGKSASERAYKKGELYLENDKRERKATGSYYTPEHIVKYIVENAVGPVLQEKFKQLTPKLRKAEKGYHEAVKRQKAFRQKGMNGDDPEKVANTYRGVVDELFSIRVLDPAMGSGHFLVETVDFVTDRMIDFLNGFRWNPVFSQLQATREQILGSMDHQGITIDPKRLKDVDLLKRHVLKRCIYGVDLNPMAVELAKVSLWLDCFTLGAPLSFLDHHMKCGNSLIGSTVSEVEDALSGTRQFWLFSSPWEGAKQALAGMMDVLGTPDITPEQVRTSRAGYRTASGYLAPFKRILDVYTSRWFGNAIRKTGRGKKKQTYDDAMDFLQSTGAKQWLENPGQTKNLSPHDEKVAEIATQAAKEKRFFHWELEFPEVFYGARPGTTQAIERLEGAGFDAVIGNPPYDVLSEKELGRDVSDEFSFFHSANVFVPAMRGKTNLYKLFICRGIDAVAQTGSLSLIVPMSLLGDDQAAGVRKLLLERTALATVETFPQKDDPKRRIFPEAKLATCVFVTEKSSTGRHFTIRTHAGRNILESSLSVRIKPIEAFGFDPSNATIPSCTQRDWDIAVALAAHNSVHRMGSVSTSFQGEVNETVQRRLGVLSTNSKDPIVLHGANICMYVVREQSQGEILRVNTKKFLQGAKKDAKAHSHEHERVGFQRSSPQNNFRRLIAARVPQGSFCLDTVSYVTDASTELDLDLLVALLNSKLLDWYFRLGSTNSKVNEYQYNALPIPMISEGGPAISWESLLQESHWGKLADAICAACNNKPGVMPKSVCDAIAEMSRRIQEIEAKRVLKNRSERSHLASDSQPIQDAIDRVLFKCYGISDDDAEYIKKRLNEML